MIGGPELGSRLPISPPTLQFDGYVLLVTQEEEEGFDSDESSVAVLTRTDSKDHLSTPVGWYSSIMSLSEEDLYPRIGLDGIMFLRLSDIGLQVLPEP